MSDFNTVMFSAFQDEMTKISNIKYLGAAAVGGGAMYGAGKAKKMYGLAKKEQGEQNADQNLKRMQALQAQIQLRKQYGSAFTEG